MHPTCTFPVNLWWTPIFNSRISCTDVKCVFVRCQDVLYLNKFCVQYYSGCTLIQSKGYYFSYFLLPPSIVAKEKRAIMAVQYILCTYCTYVYVPHTLQRAYMYIRSRQQHTFIYICLNKRCIQAYIVIVQCVMCIDTKLF